jgi:hypothetical protein
MRRMFPFTLLLACDGGASGNYLGNEGDDCTDAACAKDLVCAHDGTCQLPGVVGTEEEGGDCSASEECAYQLVCSGGNLCAPDGADGTGAAGDGCAADADCRAGFFCGDDATCEDVGIPYWEGAPCSGSDDGDFRPLFVVPDLPVSGDNDFFSLPFPNDFRLDTTGHPDLSGLSTPGDTAPLVDQLVSMVEAGTGWGLNPVVMFRFSKSQALGSIKVLSTDATVRFASIDRDAEDYGELDALSFRTSTSRGKYQCGNWLAVTTYEGRPLLPGHAYAVWLTGGITSEDGEALVRDDDFKTMFDPERPQDLSIARAWDVYQPLRDYFTDNAVSSPDVKGAVVFTTGYPERKLRYFREVVEDETWQVSLDGVEACTDCLTDRADGAEYTATLVLPGFRDEEGHVEFSASTFRPDVAGSESVPVRMVLPSQEMPETGWPVVLWLPDAGAEALDPELAEALAAGGVATLAVERGWAPDDFAVTTDAEAWLANLLTASVDPHALVRVVGEWTGDDGAFFDPDEIWFGGQGAGAEAGALFLDWAQDVRGAVLGNPAARYGVAWSERTDPFDVAHALQAGLADSNLSRFHPIVGLLQHVMDPADPQNVAEDLVREPNYAAIHVFAVDGVDDAELGADARHAWLRALEIPTAGTVRDDYGQSSTDLPAFENVNTDDGRTTAAVVQYAAGHDALTAEADRAAAAFVLSGVGEASPEIAE